MPDFEATEDPLRLSDSAEEEPLDVPELRPRFMPRTRQLTYAWCFRSGRGTRERLRPALATGVARAARRTSPYVSSRGPLAATAAKRRRLWTKCHGRPPGSPS